MRRAALAAAAASLVARRARAQAGGADPTDDALDSAAARIAAARRVVAFTGAGVSAESGIRTYRDATAGTGVWDGLVGQLGMLLFGTKIGFLFFPRTAWRLYADRLLGPIRAAEPNGGHVAIARLADEVEGGVPVVTQNIDGLHQRAGSTRVLELHGTCASHRHAWTGAPVEVASVDSPPALFTRPDVVLFFEGMPPAFWRAAALVDELGEGDVLLVVGTSCAVAPACTLPYAAMSNGAHVIEVNLERCLADDVPIDPGDNGRPVMAYGPYKDLARQQTLLRGAAAAVLPLLLERVREAKRRRGGARRRDVDLS